jgi:hypothetical protein
MPRTTRDAAIAGVPTHARVGIDARSAMRSRAMGSKDQNATKFPNRSAALCPMPDESSQERPHGGTCDVFGERAPE